MLLNGGQFNGNRLLGPRTVAWIATDHTGKGGYSRPGQTFGLGHAVTLDPAEQGFPGSKGSYFWGGAFGTLFWIDPKEELIGVLMVQVNPREGMMLREKFSALVYSAIVD